jgi:hypothetical protein
MNIQFRGILHFWAHPFPLQKNSLKLGGRILCEGYLGDRLPWICTPSFHPMANLTDKSSPK